MVRSYNSNYIVVDMKYLHIIFFRNCNLTFPVWYRLHAYTRRTTFIKQARNIIHRSLNFNSNSVVIHIILKQ
jgi:hypothetical protein